CPYTQALGRQSKCVSSLGLHLPSHPTAPRSRVDAPICLLESRPMKRVTGLGGIFFKCKDPEGVKNWYAKHLGLPVDAECGINFQWRDPNDPKVMGRTVCAPSPED